MTAPNILWLRRDLRIPAMPIACALAIVATVAAANEPFTIATPADRTVEPRIVLTVIEYVRPADPRGNHCVDLGGSDGTGEPWICGRHQLASVRIVRYLSTRPTGWRDTSRSNVRVNWLHSHARRGQRFLAVLEQEEDGGPRSLVWARSEDRGWVCFPRYDTVQWRSETIRMRSRGTPYGREPNCFRLSDLE
jgi:hypothetical protein